MLCGDYGADCAGVEGVVEGVQRAVASVRRRYIKERDRVG